MRTLAAASVAACLAACSSGGSSSSSTPPPAPAAPQAILDMEDDAHAQINAERGLDAKAPLTHDPLLRLVARAHSQDMIDRGFFNHINPDGYSPFDRMTAAGHAFLSAGENIAWNQGFPDPVAEAVTGWMNSPGHRANILNGTFTHGGLGIAVSSGGAHYFTQVFSTPTGQLILRSFVVDPAAVETTVDTDLSGRVATSSWSLR